MGWNPDGHLLASNRWVRMDRFLLAESFLSQLRRIGELEEQLRQILAGLSQGEEIAAWRERFVRRLREMKERTERLRETVAPTHPMGPAAAARLLGTGVIHMDESMEGVALRALLGMPFETGN